MSLHSTAVWLENLAFPAAIRESGSLFPAFETIHVVAVALVVGSIATVDVRLLGLGRHLESPWIVARRALPWTWGAFVVAVLSGLLMFSSAAAKYIENPAFLVKMVLLLLAGANMVIFHYGAGRGIASWEQPRAPTAARISGGLSLVFWIGVVAAGRWIGFISTSPF
jgi:hypothetical protein